MRNGMSREENPKTKEVKVTIGGALASISLTYSAKLPEPIDHR